MRVTFPRAYGWCCGLVTKPGLAILFLPNVAGFSHVGRLARENLPMRMVLEFN